MKLRRALLLVCLLLAAGCARHGVAIVTAGSTSLGDAAAYYYATCDGRVFLALVHDVRPADPTVGSHHSNRSSSGDKGIEIHGEYATDDGKRLGWSCRSPDGTTGTVVVDGTDFDLASGNLFVVADSPDGPSVTQFHADLGGSDAIEATLQRLARDVPEVRAITGDGDRN